MKASTSLPCLAAAILLVGLGCQPVNKIYKQDTGEVAAVPGPPPESASPSSTAPESSDAGDEVVFDDPATQDEAFQSEIDAIEPLPEPVEVKIYTIKKDDRYWTIAKEVYGDANRAKDIQAANPGIDPKNLQIGDEIVLP